MSRTTGARDEELWRAHAGAWEPHACVAGERHCEGCRLVRGTDPGRGLRRAWRGLPDGAHPHRPRGQPYPEEVGHCREQVPPAPVTAPLLAAVLRHRLVAVVAWLGFVASRLARGRWPRRLTVALPSVGHRGPWSTRCPLVFGGEADRSVTCLHGAVASRAALRRLLPGARHTPPEPSMSVAVRAGPRGWVVRSRHEPEMYAPVDGEVGAGGRA